jgi:hypothetical protein
MILATVGGFCEQNRMNERLEIGKHQRQLETVSFYRYLQKVASNITCTGERKSYFCSVLHERDEEYSDVNTVLD